MTEKDMLTMLFERGNAMQSFWGFYISVAFGVIAFCGSSPRSKQVAGIVAAGFICFAIVNARGMYQVDSQREALFNAIQAQAPLAVAGTNAGNDRTAATSQTLKDGLVAVSEPSSPWAVAMFHGLLDAGVLLGIWLLPRTEVTTVQPSDVRAIV